MVMSYGMSDLGPIQYEHSGGNVFLGRDYNATRNYSSQIAFEIDKSVRALIDEGQEKAKALILEHRALMDKIVEVLIEQETLTSEQIQNIVEGKPFDAVRPELLTA
jgi:cell division protease FtsH